MVARRPDERPHPPHQTRDPWKPARPKKKKDEVIILFAIAPRRRWQPSPWLRIPGRGSERKGAGRRAMPP